MSNFLSYIDIYNFKSIRNCSINDLKRINLFIGRPNVGKSNLIEALSMFSIPFLAENRSKKLNSLIRVENESELFYNGEGSKPSFIKTNIGLCEMHYHPKEGLRIMLNTRDNDSFYQVDENITIRNLKPIRSEANLPIKRYQFTTQVRYKSSHAKYLIPPSGSNLLSIIEKYPIFKKQVVELFREYNLEIAFDRASQTIKVIQQKERNEIFLIPYNSIADTLQRIIFYKAAIISNNDSVLLFEEPEAHSFPPYMSHLTQEMIYKKDNQFFVATHSPFILNDLLENAGKDLAVFIVNYKDNQTVINGLSESQLHDIFQNGVDLFTNNESFV